MIFNFDYPKMGQLRISGKTQEMALEVIVKLICSYVAVREFL